MVICIIIRLRFLPCNKPLSNILHRLVSWIITRILTDLLHRIAAIHRVHDPEHHLLFHISLRIQQRAIDIGFRPPYPLESVAELPFVHVSVVDPADELSIVPHFTTEKGLRSAVAELV